MYRFYLALAMLFVGSPSNGTPVSNASAYRFLVRYEGICSTPYRDGNGWAVGVGHRLTGHRLSYYTQEDIHTFFAWDLAISRRACRTGIFDFDSLPIDVQLVAISIAFSTGPSGFQKFIQFRAALSSRNYELAAREIKDSLWCAQVGKIRSENAIKCLVHAGFSMQKTFSTRGVYESSK